MFEWPFYLRLPLGLDKIGSRAGYDGGVLILERRLHLFVLQDESIGIVR